MFMFCVYVIYEQNIRHCVSCILLQTTKECKHDKNQLNNNKKGNKKKLVHQKGYQGTTCSMKVEMKRKVVIRKCFITLELVFFSRKICVHLQQKRKS